MNQIFDNQRFGRYLLADLSHAKTRYGLPFLALSVLPLLPLLLNLVIELFGWSFGFGAPDIRQGYNCSAAVYLGALILTISLPISLYGHFTDPRRGAEFILLPASSLEKFLSCILVTCVIVPGALILAYIVDQAIISLIGFGDAHIFSHADKDHFETMRQIFAIIPTMLLGALCFKRHKVVKTIAWAVAVAFVVAIVALIVFAISHYGGNINNITIVHDEKPFFVIYQLAILTAIYLKIRKIQY